MVSSSECGIIGEQAATEWLRRNGFLIMERNWRCGHYEIDIIASRREVIHIVEVKTRRTGSLTKPEDAITYQKFRSLRRAASAYLAQRHLSMFEIEFDLIAVDMNPDGTTNVRYIENAMECNW